MVKMTEKKEKEKKELEKINQLYSFKPEIHKK
jgi:hypothetical protein